MPFYKDQSNKVHFIDSSEFEGLLPEGCVEITETEAAQTQADTVAGFVPEQVTMRQARLALLEAGKLAAVNAAVSGMQGPQGDAARIEWEFSSTVERHRPLVASLASALSLTEAQLDALFKRAAEL